MRIADCDVVFIAEEHSFSADHWMARWEARFPNTYRVELASKAKDLAYYQESLLKALEQTKKPVVFVTSGVGGYILAHVLPILQGQDIKGAFIVNPPDFMGKHNSLLKTDLADYPKMGFPFPAILVASRSNSEAPFAHIETLAKHWNAIVLDAGDAGSLDSRSGHGPWPEGMMSFAGFLKRL